MLIKNPRPQGLGDIGLEVPCGKCLTCRINRSRMWTERLLHEASLHESNVFLTLTYNDEHLPGKIPGTNKTLVPEDLQKFWKRLRKRLKERIRFYACGEYGDKDARPHYHAIVFGLTWKDLKTRRLPSGRMTSDLISSVWDKGFNTVGMVEHASIRYVTDYVMKKWCGKKGKKEYTDKGLVPPFQRASLGIGKEYFENNRQYFIDKMGSTMFGKEVGVPRYYYRRFTDEEKELYKCKVDSIKKEQEERRLVKRGLTPADFDDRIKERLALDLRLKRSKQLEKNILSKKALRGGRPL